MWWPAYILQLHKVARVKFEFDTTALGDLKEEMRKAFLLIDTTKRKYIINLYETFRGHQVKVIVNNGNEINK